VAVITVKAVIPAEKAPATSAGTGERPCLRWPADRVVVIDEDLGRSGAGTVQRPGFQLLVTEISLGMSAWSSGSTCRGLSSARLEVRS
jgi:hypothetical protein